MGPVDAEEILYAAAPHLAELATQRMYAEQPALEAMGDSGRAHTVEDFGHHFRALASMDPERFTDHVRYCVGLFDARSFPQAWLTDAWRHMAAVISQEMTPEIAGPAVAVLASGVSAGSARPEP